MEADTISKLFLRNVREHGNRVALREKDLGIWKRVTWKDYYEHVRDFAMGLKALGFEPGDKVSILGDNCCEWLYADIATQSLHGIAVGIYPTDVAGQVKYILKNSDSKFVVARDQEQVDKVLQVKNELPLLKKVIVIDMKGLRRYKDPLIISFHETEKVGRTLHEQMPNFFEENIRSAMWQRGRTETTESFDLKSKICESPFIMLIIPLWLIMAPFGSPVVPEV